MKKVVLSVCVSCAMILTLAACGGGGSASTASSSQGGQDTQEAAAAADSGQAAADSGQAAAGEEYDVGEFTVSVPSGWMALPQQDMLAEKDEEGNYPINSGAIGLIKGGESEWDAFSKPTIYIYRIDGDAQTQAEQNEMFYDETSPMDVSVNGVKCYAFEAKSALSEDEDPYVYNMVFYPVKEDVCFQINIPVDMVTFEGVNIDDPDVQAIMQSLALK